MAKCGMYCRCIRERQIKAPIGTPNVQMWYVLPVYWGGTNKDGDPKCPSMVYILPVYWGGTNKDPDGDP